MADGAGTGEVEEASDLYGLAPTAFTAARNALAKQLKADGRADEAAAVAALRKPPVTAWALNRVARDHPELVADALAAGARLREATEAALAGDASGLREASAEQREAAGVLVDAATAVLGSGGATAQTRLSTTVHAAVLDDEVADLLRRGVLATDHDRSGLGLGDGMAALAGAPATAVPSGPPKLRILQGGRAAGSAPAADAPAGRASAAASKAAAAERERRRVALRGLRKRAADLAARADIADREAARLGREADRLEAEAERARLLAIDAEATAEDARTAHEQAETEVTDAEAETE